MDHQGLPATMAEIAASRRITPSDVVALQVEMLRGGHLSRAEVDALFDLDQHCDRKCGDWLVFFIEAVTDHVLNAGACPGHVTDGAAAWLVGSISQDGKVETETELELLLNVVEQAAAVPAILSAFAIGQIARAVVQGAGPFAAGRDLPQGIIGQADVELIRRILKAGGGPAHAAITRAEAEVLFLINDLTVEEMNDPAWDELFVKAMANHVLGGSGRAVATRAEALRREMLFEQATSDLAGFFRRMAAASADAAFAAARVAEEEAAWLAERFTSNRLIHDNERALVALIASEAEDVPPAMAPLLARAA